MSVTNIRTALDIGGTPSASIEIVSGSGNDRLVTMTGTQELGTANFPNPTVDGVAPTGTAIQEESPASNRTGVEFYWLDADLPATSGFVTATYTNPNASNVMSVLYAEGIAQSAPSDTGFISTNNQAGGTIALSGAGTGALLVGAMIMDNNTPNLAVESGQTAIADNVTNGSWKAISSYNTDDNTHGYTATQSLDQVIIAVSFDLVAAAGPSITSTTDPAITGANITIIGTGFGASQGLGSVKQEQGAVVETLSIVSWSDTSITATSSTIESTQLKYGTQTLRVTDNAAADDTTTFVANPISGEDFVDLTSVATVGQLLTISGSLAISDEIVYQDVLHDGGSPTAFFFTVNADATFTFDGATPDGNYTAGIGVWDTSDSTWGARANQLVQVGNPPPPVEDETLYKRMRGLTQIGTNGIFFAFTDETRTLAEMSGAYFSNKYASTSLTTGDILVLQGSDGAKWINLTVVGMTVTFDSEAAFL